MIPPLCKWAHLTCESYINSKWTFRKRHFSSLQLCVFSTFKRLPKTVIDEGHTVFSLHVIACNRASACNLLTAKILSRNERRGLKALLFCGTNTNNIICCWSRVLWSRGGELSVEDSKICQERCCSLNSPRFSIFNNQTVSWK